MRGVLQVVNTSYARQPCRRQLFHLPPHHARFKTRGCASARAIARAQTSSAVRPIRQSRQCFALSLQGQHRQHRRIGSNSAHPRGVEAISIASASRVQEPHLTRRGVAGPQPDPDDVTRRRGRGELVLGQDTPALLGQDSFSTAFEGSLHATPLLGTPDSTRVTRTRAAAGRLANGYDGGYDARGHPGHHQGAQAVP